MVLELPVLYCILILSPQAGTINSLVGLEILEFLMNIMGCRKRFIRLKLYQKPLKFIIKIILCRLEFTIIPLGVGNHVPVSYTHLKANRTEKPDQDVPRHGLAAGTADCGFNIAFLQSKRRYRQGKRKQKNGAQPRNDSMIFLRGNDLLHGKRI